MPIYELTGDARLTKIGQLRKGGAKPNDRQPGPDLDSALRFVGVDEDVQAAWNDFYGPDPFDGELSIRLPYATVDEVWQAWRESYTASALQVRCNGREHVLYLAPDGVTYISDRPVPCPGASCDCKPCGRLDVLIPEFGRMGVITVLTTSVHDIRNIDGCLRMLAITLGDLRRVPLRLTRVKRMISTPRQGKRVRVAKWLLHLEPEPEWVALMMPRHEPAAVGLLGTAAMPALTDGSHGEEYEDDGDAVLVEMPGAAAAGFTERIDACGTLRELMALWPDIEAIDEASRKGNTITLYWRRFVAIVDRAASSANASDLERLARAILNVPVGTDGLDDARSHLGARRDELAEAGVIDVRQPALA